MKNGSRGVSILALMKKIVIAALIFLFVLAGMVAILSVVIDKEILGVENAGYGIVVILLMAAIVCGVVLKIRYGKDWGNIGIGSAADAIVLVTICLLFFEGGVMNTVPSLFVVIAGNTLPYLLFSVRKNKSKQYTTKRRNS